MGFGTFDNEDDWHDFSKSSLEKFTGGGIIPQELKKKSEDEPLPEEENEDPTEEEEPEEIKIRLSNAQFLRPSSGYELGENATIEVKVEEVGDNPDKDVHFSLYANYKDSKNEFLSRTGATYSDGVAKTSIYLDYPEAYLSDLENECEADVFIYCIASHDQCSEDAQSRTLKLPDMGGGADSAAQAAILQKAAKEGAPFCEECEKVDKEQKSNSKV